MKNNIKASKRNSESGQGITEYALILLMVVIVVIVVLVVLGPVIAELWRNTVGPICQATHGCSVQ